MSAPKTLYPFRHSSSPDEQSAGSAAPGSGASSGDSSSVCTCNPESYDVGPEGQRRYFPDRGCAVHGDPQWMAQQDDDPEQALKAEDMRLIVEAINAL